jgi:hypothetical protein
MTYESYEEAVEDANELPDSLVIPILFSDEEGLK